MIIWSGFGFLAALIPIATLVLGGVLCKWVTGDDTLYDNNLLLRLFSFGLASLLVWFLGKRLNGRPGKILIDPATGQPVILKQRHSLFFIPMEYWAFVIALIAIAVGFQSR
mgnify:CR=1 FL=1